MHYRIKIYGEYTPKKYRTEAAAMKAAVAAEQAKETETHYFYPAKVIMVEESGLYRSHTEIYPTYGPTYTHWL